MWRRCQRFGGLPEANDESVVGSYTQVNNSICNTFQQKGGT